MAQRQSWRLRSLDIEIVPETSRDKHCIFCLIDEHHGFNIIAGNVLRFPCCRKFADRSCQREWERNSELCPHCRRKLPNEGNDEAPMEAIELHNGQIPPWQQAINALQAVMEDRARLEQQINTVSLAFLNMASVSKLTWLPHASSEWANQRLFYTHGLKSRILQTHCCYVLTFVKH